MVKIFEGSDFDEISIWAKARQETWIREMLPSYGLIAHGLCAGFLFHDPASSLAFLHGIISNPVADRARVREALHELYKTCLKHCEARGIKILYFTTHNKGVERFAHDAGFIQVENGMKGFVKVL